MFDKLRINILAYVMPVTVNTSRNALLTDKEEFLVCDSSDEIILTINNGIFAADDWFTVYRAGLGEVTLTPGSVDITFEFDTELYDPKVSARYKTVLVYFKASNRAILSNNLKLKTGSVVIDPTTIAVLAYQYGALI